MKTKKKSEGLPRLHPKKQTYLFFYFTQTPNYTTHLLTPLTLATGQLTTNTVFAYTEKN